MVGLGKQFWSFFLTVTSAPEQSFALLQQHGVVSRALQEDPKAPSTACREAMVALQALLQNPPWSLRNDHQILGGETAQQLCESHSSHPDNSANTLAGKTREMTRALARIQDGRMSIRKGRSSAESSAGQNPGGSHPAGCTGTSLLCISSALWRCSNGPPTPNKL